MVVHVLIDLLYCMLIYLNTFYQKNLSRLISSIHPCKLIKINLTDIFFSAKLSLVFLQKK